MKMTEKEAVERLNANNERRTATGYLIIKKMAIEALEKQIPQKVVAETEEDREFVDYLCPVCKVILQQKYKQSKRALIYPYKHCSECGQVLDWSDISDR